MVRVAPSIFIKIHKNVPLAKYTTFKIGGPARYFFITKTTKDLIEAVKFAQDKGLPYFILGGGSNLLVNDKGFDGMVIKIQNGQTTPILVKLKVENSRIVAEAGTSLVKLVEISIEKSLTGLEFAAGIPGTVGGALYGNAGSQRDNSIGDLVETVTLLKPTGQIITVDKDWMQFDYRHSHLKDITEKTRPIILSAVLKLAKGDSKKIKRKINERITTRVENIPLEPSAGCIFKNPPSQSAGYLIEKCGLKGKKIGQAMISEKHANFIVNLGQAKANDVIKLIQIIKKSVKEKFKINLEEEVQYLGF